MTGHLWARARPAERALTLLAAGLAALGLLLLVLPPGGEAPAARFALVGRSAPGADRAPDTVQADATIALARPLFASGRRPPAVAATGPVQMPRLAGVIVSHDGPPKAIFAADGDAKPPVLGVGAQVGGHVIRAIGAASVTLDDGTVLHPVFAAGPVGGGSGPAPAGAFVPPAPPPLPNAQGPMVHHGRGL